MSDFYLCEHKERCCGTCIRGAKTENNKLQSQLSQVQGELDKSHKDFDSMEESFLKTSSMLTKACMKNKTLWEQLNLWKAERDALKAENERLRGALEITANNIGLIQDGSSQQRWAKIVDQALSSNEGA